LTCRQCKALDVIEDQEGTSMGNSKKKGYEQMNKDDEEEYSRMDSHCRRKRQRL
jgi:hypothetical protein